MSHNIAYYDSNGQIIVSTPSLMNDDSLYSNTSVEDDERVVLTLMGAGRGPLIVCALNAARKTKRSIVIYALEKNPNAIITLHSLHNSLNWGERVQIVEADMRRYHPVFYSDIIFSELLGSIGDNELSPECLYGTESYLIAGGVFLPRDCTSYFSLCMSSRIYTNVRVGLIGVVFVSGYSLFFSAFHVISSSSSFLYFHLSE